MKVGIITFHRAINYGAVLQTLALQKTIEKFNVEVEVIDYRCKTIEDNYSNIRIKKNRIFKDSFNSILSYSIRKSKKDKFYKFNKKNLNLSKEVYYSNKNLKNANSIYDIFITGSDQVWDNKCVNFDSSYFLSFVDESRKKNSYAASFAFSKLPIELTEEYRKRLCNFENISVREEAGKSIFTNLLNRDISVDLDPTLLLDRNEWSLYAEDNFQKEKYILLYSVNKPKELFKYAEDISNKLGYKIIYINDSLKREVNAEYLRSVSPSEFISLFKNAEFILSNSFHGTVFSIIFEKNFLVEINSKNNKVNHRSKNLLELLDLENRILENKQYKDWINNIDYSESKKILKHKRDESLNYLQNLLNNK